jgi:hypothetical protein
MVPDFPTVSFVLPFPFVNLALSNSLDQNITLAKNELDCCHEIDIYIMLLEGVVPLAINQ